MRRAVAIVFCFLLNVSTGAIQPDVEVIASGMAPTGPDRAAAIDEAVLDAKRNAVEQAVGVLVDAEALAQDYEVIWDSIRTRSQGYIKRWELLGEPEWDTRAGLVKVRIRAVVGTAEAVKDLWQIPEVYNALERPRVGVKLVGAGTSQSEPLSTAALAHALRVRGFDVSDSTASLPEVLVVGTVRTEMTIRLGDPNTPYKVGERVGVCKAFAEVRVVWADSGATIVPPLRWESAGFSFASNEEARQEALRKVGADLVEESGGALAQKLIGAWMAQLQNGLRVRFVVRGADYRTLAQFADRLRQMHGVVRVERERMEAGGGMVEAVVRTTPAVLRRQLLRLQVGTKRVVILRHSPSAIRLALK